MYNRSPGHQVTRSQVYVVILVGGKGKRLRPLSNDSKPKAFLSIAKDRKTMFKNTVERALKIVPRDRIIVAANRRHAHLVKKDFPDIREENLILEPVSKNTAPAIALAASVISKGSDDPIMVVLPTDQYITGEGKYVSAIKRAVDFAGRNDKAIIVLGVKPSSPSTEFGYLKVTRSPRHQVTGILKVEKFTEKPGLQLAKKYVKSGRYLWNAGGFIFRAGTILKAIKKFAPEIFDGLKDLDDLGEAYEKMPDISIDYAVMEKADNIYCAKGSYGWQDLGSFSSLAAALKKESRDFIRKGGKIIKII